MSVPKDFVENETVLGSADGNNYPRTRRTEKFLKTTENVGGVSCTRVILNRFCTK